MYLSRGTRVVSAALAVLVGLGAFFAFGIEREYGGQEAIEGLAKGYLPENLVEVRAVGWALDTEAASDYEVTEEGSGATVRLVDGGGRILFTGTLAEAQAWLDEQGEQQYLGTNAGADAYLDELRDGAKDHRASLFLAIIAVVFLVLALIPTKADQRASTLDPATPRI